MRAVPEYFRAAAQVGEPTSLIPFFYDAGPEQFDVAGTRVPLRAFDPDDASFLPDIDDDREVGHNAIGYHALYLTPFPGRLLATPKLHDWAKRHTSNMDMMQYVMLGAYHHIRTGEVATEEDIRESYIGCSVELQSNGGLIIHTLGSCACISPAADAIFVRGPIENGYGEYELHNAFTHAQRASLYAGLGHFAQMAMSA